MVCCLNIYDNLPSWKPKLEKIWTLWTGPPETILFMARLKIVEQEQHAGSTGSFKVRRSPPRRCNETALGRALGADRSSRARPQPIIRVRKMPTKDEQALIYGAYISLPPVGRARNSQLKKLCAKYGVNIRYPQIMKAKLEKTRLLNTREHVGGRKQTITEEKEAALNLDAFERQILTEVDAYPPEKLNAIFDMKSRVLACIVEHAIP